MLVIIGKTASGKTTLREKMVKEYGFNPIITYTTRPMRKGEEEGKTYHYITDEEFNEKIKEGFFAEYKEYNTKKGIWKYGSAKEDLINSDKSSIIILTPGGVEDIRKNLPEIDIRDLPAMFPCWLTMPTVSGLRFTTAVWREPVCRFS